MNPNDQKDTSQEPPSPEVLQPQSDEATSDTTSSDKPVASTHPATPRRTTYRPSHKATFLGLGAVAVILGINVAVIMFVLKGQAVPSSTVPNSDAVTLSPQALDKLGVSQNTVGNAGSRLIVNPNASFNGDVTIAKDISIAGQLKLNSKFTASDASIAKLQAGDTSVQKLSINGEALASTLNLSKDLSVVGTTRLQGPVTMSQLLTVNNSVNIAGNLGVGGTLSVRSLHVASFVTDTTLTVGGHIVTQGAAPGVSPGGSLGSNGTVSISGNDTAGTVAVNIGAGGGGGVLAQVSFRSKYPTTPHVVVTTVGAGAGGVYINRSGNGFSIGINGAIPPGGYAFDYIVMQ